MKRKSKERSQKRNWARIFVRIAIISAIAIPLLCGFFIDFALNVDKRPEHFAVERSLTQLAKVPPASRVRSLESEIEYEGLKETLFKIVLDTEISIVLDDHYIAYFTEPHYCGVGHSINYVSTNTPFTEVVQRYNTWAANNDWHFEHSVEDDRPHIYHNSPKARSYRTTLTIRPLVPVPNPQVSRLINPVLATHFRLELEYVDPLCGEHNVRARQEDQQKATP